MELGPTVSLWKNIFDKELANLQTGKRKAGEVFATVESLAAAYHVSDITARRVLSELAKAGAVRNIPRKGSVVAGNALRIRYFCFPRSRFPVKKLR